MVGKDIEAEKSESAISSLSVTKTPPGSPVDASLTNCSSHSTRKNSLTCDCRSTLEEEAVAAVREFSFAVETICISEMLPRTGDLLFINLTTLEGSTYCMELTGKGYRVASNRQDCMNGDFRQLSLHTRYFESLYQFLDTFSPQYREKFGSQLANKLEELRSKMNS